MLLHDLLYSHAPLVAVADKTRPLTTSRPSVRGSVADQSMLCCPPREHCYAQRPSDRQLAASQEVCRSLTSAMLPGLVTLQLLLADLAPLPVTGCQ